MMPGDSPPSRSPEARREEYLRLRKPRQCKQCSADLELGTKRQLCDTCRTAPNPRCKKCKKVKSLSAFSHDATRPSGYFPWCMECQRAGVKAGAFQNPEDELNGHICPMDDVPIRGHRNRRFCCNGCKDRASNLRSAYNLTPRQYRDIVEATGGKCPICLKAPTSWQVDHNHSSLRVMGAVCINCNVHALAYTFHDPAFIRRLLDFVENPPALAAGVDALAKEQENKPGLHKVWGRNPYKRKRDPQ